MIRGSQGYTEQAPELIARYESIPFEYKHAELMHLFPPVPAMVLDIGAGTGADAAWLALEGHEVCAVEPTEAFRNFGESRHASPRIQWIDDCLPRLDRVVQRSRCYDLILLTAVWMHLDEHERQQAMPVLASVLAPGGILVMAVRHGPVPQGRTMFDVPAEETIALAEANGLSCILSIHTESRLAENREAGVTWSRLAFRQARS